MKLRRWYWVGAVSLAFVGCGDDGDGSVNAVGFSTLASKAALTRANSCDEALARLQGDAIARLEVDADGVRAVSSRFFGDGDVAVSVDGNGALGAPASSSGESTAVDTASSGAGGDGPSERANTGVSGDLRDSVTETNTQVEGVDEADFVKTDGDFIYLLHGTRFKVIRSWPAVDTASVGEFTLQGNPSAMFVSEGRAAIFSNVELGDLVTCQNRDRGAWGRVPVDDLAYERPCGREGVAVTIVALDAASGEFTKVSEHRYEGRYHDARLHNGRIVRLTLRARGQFPVALPSIDDGWDHTWSSERVEAHIAEWKAAASEAIMTTTLDEWLPKGWSDDGTPDAITEESCKNVYVPGSGMSNHGFTSLVTLDMREPYTGHVAHVVGAATEIYGGAPDKNGDSIFAIMQNDYSWRTRANVGSEPVHSEQTVIHLFAINGTTTEYLATGAVPGTVLNQFSAHYDGTSFFVATTRSMVSPGGDGLWVGIGNRFGNTENQLMALQVDGGELKTVGTSPVMAPGERIFSVRYVRDRAYVVTFRQVDPLFVLDISNAGSIPVLGEVKIPGFSDYMHPLGACHLLTVGQEDFKLKLEIFDVCDAADPRSVHKYLFEEYGSSSASWDHKNFVFDSVNQLLTFPVTYFDGAFRSAAEVFEVDVESGFARAGAVDHGSLLDESCYAEQFWGCFYAPEVRRGLLMSRDNRGYLYTMSFGGLLVHDLRTFDEVARVEFESPDRSYGGVAVGVEPVRAQPDPDGEPLPQ